MGIDQADPRWLELKGGYKVPYDPRGAIKRLESNAIDPAAWEELWNNLHHQGDVGDASYAAVPLLVQVQDRRLDLGWNLYGLCSAIESERFRVSNPELPEWLAGSYSEAWRQLLSHALRELEQPADCETLQTCLAVVALAHRAVRLGALIVFLDPPEIEELTENYLAWSELYRPAV